MVLGRSEPKGLAVARQPPRSGVLGIAGLIRGDERVSFYTSRHPWGVRRLALTELAGGPCRSPQWSSEQVPRS